MQSIVVAFVATIAIATAFVPAGRTVSQRCVLRSIFCNLQRAILSPAVGT